VTRRGWLRVGGLVLVAVAAAVALTVYFSSERVPPCFVSGVARWRPPADGAAHRFMLAFPDRAVCFFALDDENKLVGTLSLPSVRHVSYAAPLSQDLGLRTAAGPVTLDLHSGRAHDGGVAPFDYDTLTLADVARQVMYVTQRDLLGFRVIDLRTGATRYAVHFQGFTWNRRFGPNPPSHGLALAPDRPRLWVLDAPNRTVHLFDVSGLPDAPPRRVADVRLQKTLAGVGSLTLSADGRYLYVAESGDVVDTRLREVVTHLEALQHSHVAFEVDWVDGRPVFPGFPR
jgi:hypothetical protein